MTILRCTNDQGVKYDLDLKEEVPFRLDISAIESGDIGKVFGVSSQKFTLPPTKTNNDFFGNTYDVGATPTVQFIKTVTCQVLQNGTEIFTGKLYLESVITDNNGDYLYNVVVVNETVDFNLLVQNKTFGDLDFSSLNHTYSYGNITSSWDQTLVDGGIFYPLVNYGFDEENPLDTQIRGGGGDRSFTNYDSPIRVDDFKPAIRLREALDAIFAITDYEYTSSLFYSGSYTDDIYMLSTKNDKKGINDISPVSQSFRAYTTASQDYAAPTVYSTVYFPAENWDNADNYDNTVSRFTAGISGVYQFEINLVYEILGYSAVGDSRFIDVGVFKNGSKIDTYNFDLTGVVQGQANLLTQGYNLNATDTIQIRLSFTKSGAGAETFRVVASGNSRFKSVVAPLALLGGTVDVASNFDNINILEFLQGLIEKFNLVIEPVRNERNVLRIETFNDWVDQGTTKDWNDKVDYSQKWEIKHPLQGQPKNIRFSDVEDETALVQYHKRTFGKMYGEYKYISESDLAKGEKELGSLFGALPMKGVDGAPMTVVPILASKEASEPYRRLQFAPRLVYHNGRQDANGLIGKDVSNNRSAGVYYFQDETGTTHAESDYGLAHHLQAIPSVFESTNDLHFGNLYSPGHWSYHQPQYNAKAKNTAFQKYWAFYINELYDVDSRLVTLNIFLAPNEIPEIALNDKIFIDGHYYRINKISGANITREDSVAVELIKTLPRKISYPRRRISTLDDTYVDITLDDASWDEAGMVEYVEFENGAVYSGSAITVAAERDNLEIYGSQVIWDTQKPVSAKFTAQTNLGLNRVDLSADIVDVRGDNNTISNNVNVARVEGGSNDVRAYASFVSVTGENNVVDYDLERVQITGNGNTISGSSSDSSIISSNNSTIFDSSKAVIIGGQGTSNLVEGANEAVLVNPFNITLSGSTNPVTVIGGENVDITGGNYHVVIGKDDDVTSTLDLNEYRFNTNVLNGTYLDNDTYLNRYGYEIDAYAGGTTFAYSGEGLYKTYYNLTWSTVSGSGVHTVELPGITSQDQEGRTILIKGDSTLNVSSSVYITSIAGTDTFDGSAGITLNRPYEWVELRAGYEGRNTEWRIISFGTAYEGIPSAQGTHGSFYSTSSQALITPNVSQSVTLGNTFNSNHINLTGSGAVKMDYAGTYRMTFVCQVENTDNAYQYANFWIKYNGVDYPNSGTRVSCVPRKSSTEFSYTPVTVTMLDTALNDNDQVELYWLGSSTTLSLQYTTGSYGDPNAPSATIQINGV